MIVKQFLSDLFHFGIWMLVGCGFIGAMYGVWIHELFIVSVGGGMIIFAIILILSDLFIFISKQDKLEELIK